MALRHALVAELELEAAITRRVRERVPDDRLAWTPHPKSMTAGELALHVASSPDDRREALRRTAAHVASAPRSPSDVIRTEEERATGWESGQNAGDRPEIRKASSRGLAVSLIFGCGGGI